MIVLYSSSAGIIILHNGDLHNQLELLTTLLHSYIVTTNKSVQDTVIQSLNHLDILIRFGVSLFNSSALIFQLFIKKGRINNQFLGKTQRI